MNQSIHCPVCGGIISGGGCTNSGCMRSPNYNIDDSGKAPSAPPRKKGKCFSLDTPVLTPDGWREIGHIREGDTVLSWCPNDLQISHKIVKRIKEGSCVSTINIRTVKYESLLRVVWTHRLLTENGGRWAGLLRPDSRLLAFDDGKLFSNSVVSVEAGQKEPVRNLLVEHNYTFIVRGALADSFSLIPRTRRTLARMVERVLETRPSILPA